MAAKNETRFPLTPAGQLILDSTRPPAPPSAPLPPTISLDLRPAEARIAAQILAQTIEAGEESEGGTIPQDAADLRLDGDQWTDLRRALRKLHAAMAGRREVD